MALKLTDEGGKHILDVFFCEATRGTLNLRLFVSNEALSDNDNYETRTYIENGNAGYDELRNLDSVASAVSLDNGVPIVNWEDVDYIFTGKITSVVDWDGLGGSSTSTVAEATIYGYEVVMNSKVLFEELLAVPFTPQNNGDKLTLSLQFKLGNGTPQ